MDVLVAVDAPHGPALAEMLAREGCAIASVTSASGPAAAADDGMLGDEGREVLGALSHAHALVLDLRRDTISPALVTACDRAGVRIVALSRRPDDDRLAQIYGLAPPVPLFAQTGASASSHPGGAAASYNAAAIARVIGAHDLPGADAGAGTPRGRVIVVWGSAGAPGRSSVAVEVAMELSRDGRHVALVDGDTHAPSLALALGLADEGPGFAAACRSAERGTVNPAELTRISVPLSARVDVLTGLNRPARWPELSESRVARALDACREWCDDTVVDVAAPLERDEEIMSDLDGPRRNAATLAAVRAADVVIAVTAADPVSISRLIRALPDLRATIGTTRVLIVVNKLRPGALGVDARTQVRQTLELYAGASDVWFVPFDAKAADAAMLQARPVLEVAGRSAFSGAVRRFVGDALAAPVRVAEHGRRRDRGRAHARDARLA